MRWEELRPGDQLVPLDGYSNAVPCIVLEAQVDPTLTEPSPFGTREIVKLTFLDVRDGSVFKETRYASGSAALGFEVMRDNVRVA